MALPSWPPNQPLNKADNVQFLSCQASGFFYKAPNDLKNVVARDPPFIPDTLITADATFGLPTWETVPDPGQDLRPTGSPQFEILTIPGTVTGEGQVSASDYANIGDEQSGNYWTTPDILTPGLFNGQRGWLQRTGPDNLTEFKKGQDLLAFSTTLPQPLIFTPGFDNFWYGETNTGFITNSWLKFTLFAASPYQVADNILTNPQGESSWIRTGPINQPVFTLAPGAEGGLFKVDWSFSTSWSIEFAGLQTNFSGIVATLTPGGFIDIGSGKTNLASTQKDAGNLVTSLQGRGYVEVAQGGSIAFFGMIGTPDVATPANGALYPRNLAVRVKRVSAY